MTVPASDVPVLGVTDLAKSFGGVKAVDGVSFTLAAGTLLALIGPNGAGKTTCFNMLMGQLRPDRGRVLLKGRDITGLSPRRVWRLGVGRTFQIAETFASMTLRENVQMALLSHHGGIWNMIGLASHSYRDEAEALLALVGMEALADRACGELAYGDIKRVELAIALANAPSLLLMDEPTAGMAPREREALMHLTARIAREQAIAVLFTEHDMDAVFNHADTILVLDRGRLIAQGSPAAIRDNAMVRSVYLGGGSTFAAQTPAEA
jgi:branched-chain amino acid transport system ATP-binding protein